MNFGIQGEVTYFTEGNNCNDHIMLRQFQTICVYIKLRTQESQTENILLNV